MSSASTCSFRCWSLSRLPAGASDGACHTSPGRPDTAWQVHLTLPLPASDEGVDVGKVRCPQVTARYTGVQSRGARRRGGRTAAGTCGQHRQRRAPHDPRHRSPRLDAAPRRPTAQVRRSSLAKQERPVRARASGTPGPSSRSMHRHHLLANAHPGEGVVVVVRVVPDRQRLGDTGRARRRSDQGRAADADSSPRTGAMPLDRAALRTREPVRAARTRPGRHGCARAAPRRAPSSSATSSMAAYLAVAGGGLRATVRPHLDSANDEQSRSPCRSSAPAVRCASTAEPLLKLMVDDHRRTSPAAPNATRRR